MTIEWCMVSIVERMAQCSLFSPRHYPLMTREELDSLLVFERVDGEWVRTVHRHTSRQKLGKHYVVFRYLRLLSY